MTFKKVPKIAYVMTPITFGGAERVNLNFLENVDRNKFRIEPILFLRPWEKGNVFEAELKRIGFSYHSIPVAKSPKNDSFQLVRRFRTLQKIVASNSYDLIHSHGYLADILGGVASKLCGIPIVSTCHGYINGGLKLSLYNTMDRLLLNSFTKIIAVSEQLKHDLIRGGMHRDKIAVLINTPSCSCSCNPSVRRALRKQFEIGENDILIGYVGRLSKEKGLKYLLESMKYLRSQSLPIKLVIIGEGPQREELDNLVAGHNLQANVFFSGFQKNIDEWLTAIDLFVLPSLTEGTPMVLLEAMAHGVPCIASAVGGIPAIIESGVNGILAAPGKPEEITGAVLSVINDPHFKALLCRNAKDTIRSNFSITQWTSKIETLYLDILN